MVQSAHRNGRFMLTVKILCGIFQHQLWFVTGWPLVSNELKGVIIRGLFLGREVIDKTLKQMIYYCYGNYRKGL
ncbi:MAG: hypothetical protein HQK99_11190 [Nitrospirae bacterium]|nr:hypothetical protein [Nitrospirota bacterium]